MNMLWRNLFSVRHPLTQFLTIPKLVGFWIDVLNVKLVVWCQFLYNNTVKKTPTLNEYSDYEKKGVILHGGGARMLCHESPNVSGRGPGGYWVSQLPFMQKSGEKKPNVHFSPTGFSINGGHRSGRYIGKTSKFSKVVTPFKGTNAKGYGGTQGKYPISAVIQGTGSDVAGIQQLYMKPSSLATKTMLTKN